MPQKHHEIPTNANKTQNYFSSRSTEQQSGFEGSIKMQDQQSHCRTARVRNSDDIFPESYINEMSQSICPCNAFQPNGNGQTL